jgi:hypothetical protein
MQCLEVPWGVSPISVCINISARLSSAENQCLKLASNAWCFVASAALKRKEVWTETTSRSSLLGSNYIPGGR